MHKDFYVILHKQSEQLVTAGRLTPYGLPLQFSGPVRLAGKLSALSEKTTPHRYNPPSPLPQPPTTRRKLTHTHTPRASKDELRTCEPAADAAGPCGQDCSRAPKVGTDRVQGQTGGKLFFIYFGKRNEEERKREHGKHYSELYR